MATKDNELRELANEYSKRAYEAFEKKDLGETADLLRDAVHLYKVCGDDSAYVRCMNFLGAVYANMGDENIAVEYYLEGLEIAKTKNLSGTAPMMYNNIGSRYQELGQHKTAIFYFEQAIERQKQEEKEGEEDPSHFFVYYLNLCISHQKTGELEKAKKYLQLAEKTLRGEQAEQFQMTILMLKCSICWDMGKQEFVKQHSEELLLLSKKLNVVADYIQNVQELAALFKKTNNYECWNTLLTYVEETAKKQEMVYYHLVSVEMWMEFYHTTGEFEKYGSLCIQHAELYQQQKKITDNERIQNLDIRIALKEKDEQRRIAEAKAETDNLTEQGNRYRLEKDTINLVHAAVRQERQIAIGIIDIDCFKQLNDTYGHNAGDACLREVGTLLKNAVAGFGSVYRFGGDEFVILIFQGDIETVKQIGERIKAKIAEAAIENKNSTVSDMLTISQGYACFRPKEDKGLADFLEYADRALYKIKNDGKDGYEIIPEVF